MLKKYDITIRGIPLSYNAALQSRYAVSLNKLINKMSLETNEKLKSLFDGSLAEDFFEQQKEAAAMDASLTVKAKKLVNLLAEKFNRLFSLESTVLSENMVENTSKVSKSNLGTSLKKLTGGLSLKTGVVPEGMKTVAEAIIQENVSLIKSIPQQYFKNIAGSVMRSITTGAGIKDLIPEIQKYKGQTLRRARNLALDQTRKAYSAINKQRMQYLDIKKFEWLHSGGGQHPRKSHIAMSGKVFSFDNLPVINQEQVGAGTEAPVKGIPGQAINCKCVMIPVVDYEGD